MSSQSATSYQTSSAPEGSIIAEGPAGNHSAAGSAPACREKLLLRDPVRYSSGQQVAECEALEPNARGKSAVAFTSQGFLLPGIHTATFGEAEQLLAFNASRRAQWLQLERFIEWVRSSNHFACIYLDGGFVSRKQKPEDIDCILQSRAPYGTSALESMIPYFSYGLDRILREYSVHLHFWAEGFPGGVQDFRMFFQYVRPREAAESSLTPHERKGILRLNLSEKREMPGEPVLSYFSSDAIHSPRIVAEEVTPATHVQSLTAAAISPAIRKNSNVVRRRS
jgi:hypothetical protein